MGIEIDPIFGCHLATGKLDKDGYAYHGQSRAHIVAWERVNGLVPDGRVLDHLCRNRACAAPHHLEPVTQSENEHRKKFAYRCRMLTKCPVGHDLKRNGIITPQGGRVCRQCNRDSQQ